MSGELDSNNPYLSLSDEELDDVIRGKIRIENAAMDHMEAWLKLRGIRTVKDLNSSTTLERDAYHGIVPLDYMLAGHLNPPTEKPESLILRRRRLAEVYLAALGKRANLTYLQLMLLGSLIEARGATLSNREIMEASGISGTSSAVREQFKRLRKKIGTGPIQNVRGFGYRWRGLILEPEGVSSTE